MKNPEYEKGESYQNQGFSEKELDLDIEVKAGEWQNLRKFNAYKRRSRQGKIIATYQAVSNRLNQLVALYYKFVSDNPRQAEKLLVELKKLRLIQEILLNCLVWSRHAERDPAMQDEKRSGSAREQMGKNDEDLKKKVPKEVWDLIE